VRVLLAAAGESDVNVSTSHRSVKFDMEIDDEPTFLLCKSVDAKFPPWEKVVPKSWERTLKVRREDLVAAIGRVSIVSRLKLPTVVLTMTSEGSLLHPDGSVTIASEVSSAGEGSESVEALYDGTDKFMIGFNETYLSCALSAMHGETMTMCFNSGTDAVIVRGDDDDPYWVVMPFRL
jgi:DNA polymerase-3 subunit beta